MRTITLLLTASAIAATVGLSKLAAVSAADAKAHTKAVAEKKRFTERKRISACRAIFGDNQDDINQCLMKSQSK